MNENELRRKIKKVFDDSGIYCKDIHGSSEFGIDLLFIKADIFGVNNVYGIQIKNTNIGSKNNKTTKEVKEIIGQIGIAWNNKFLIQRQKLLLNGIYIITTGEISNSAEDYIYSANKNIRNLFLIDGEELKIFLKKGEFKRDKYEE